MSILKINRNVFWTWFIAAIVVVCICIILQHLILARENNRNVTEVKKYNILVVSICSLRWDMIGFDINGNENTPNLTSFAKKAFVFENAVAGVSWSNVNGFFSSITKGELREAGYTALGNPWSDIEKQLKVVTKETSEFYFLSPSYTETERPKNIYFENKLQLKKRILDKRNWPFFVEYHTKMLHFPYRKRPKDGAETDLEEISKEDIKYVNEGVKKFKADPNKYAEKIFISLLLSSTTQIDRDILSKLPINMSSKKIEDFFKINRPTYAGLLNNELLLTKWRNSADYNRDKEIIKRFYTARLKQFDGFIGDILLGFGDKDLMENTVIIFTGDHGEALGEHGYTIHSKHVYDEMLRFPLAIKFPGQTTAEYLSPQFYQGSLLDVVREVMAGQVNLYNFKKYIKKMDVRDEYILAKNCSATVFSVRKKNEWKLIVDFINNEKKLFHLKNDPNERIDVIEKYPEVAGELEEFWQENIKKWRFNSLDISCANLGNN